MEQINRTPLLTETPRLSHEQESDRLHHALVSVSRGLLQYASQCAPWTPVGESDRFDQLHRLAAIQQDDIQRLCDLLIERDKAIDWNVFPVEYTSYNDVSLDFLWPKIAEFQSRLVQILEVVRDELLHDPQVTTVLDDIIRTEREILNEFTSTNETVPRLFGLFSHRSVDPLRRSSREQVFAV